LLQSSEINTSVEATQPFLLNETPDSEQPDREISTIEREPESQPGAYQEELWNKKDVSGTDRLKDIGLHEGEHEQDETKGTVRDVRFITRLAVSSIMGSIIWFFIVVIWALSRVSVNGISDFSPNGFVLIFYWIISAVASWIILSRIGPLKKKQFKVSYKSSKQG